MASPQTSAGPKGLTVITGGSSGVGKATVEAFAEAGTDVVFTYNRNESAAHELANRITGVGGSCTPMHLDAGGEASVMSFVDALRALDRPIATLVNCAGQVFRGAVPDTPTETFRAQLEVNVVAPFVLTRELAPLLRGGSIVNVASISSVTGMVDRSAYCTSKAAIAGLTSATATELAPHTRVNAVLAGILATPMNQGLLENKELLSTVAVRVPLGRLGEGAEIADVIVFLASEGARYVTGAMWEVDGGVLARTSLPAGDPRLDG
ncbi:MAG: SDR family NAD(P)-dependent oxidoreductase [Actinomycetota bacterium]